MKIAILEIGAKVVEVDIGLKDRLEERLTKRVLAAMGCDMYMDFQSLETVLQGFFTGNKELPRMTVAIPLTS